MEGELVFMGNIRPLTTDKPVFQPNCAAGLKPTTSFVNPAFNLSPPDKV